MLLRERIKLLPVITGMISSVVLLGIILLPLFIHINNGMQRVLISIMLLSGIILLASVFFAVIIVIVINRNRKCFEEIKEHLSTKEFVPIKLRANAVLLKEPNKYKEYISNEFRYFVILDEDNHLLIKIKDEDKIKHHLELGDNYILFYDSFIFI